MTPDWRELPIYSQNPDEAPTTFAERLAAMRRAAAAGHQNEAFDEGLELALALHYAGQDGNALELLDELCSFVNQGDVAPANWPWLFNTRGVALSGAGRHADADAAYRRMQKLAEDLVDRSAAQVITSTALQNQGILALETDDPERAARLLGDALATKVELDDTIAALDIFNSLALAYAALGRLDEADNMLSRVEEVARELRDPGRLGSALGNRGLIKVRRGELSGAEADFRAALRYERAAGDVLKELVGMANVARVIAEQGQDGRALRWYRRAARRAAEAGASAHEMRLCRDTALTLLRLARPTDALPKMRRALEIAEGLGNRKVVAECLADLGALRVQLGDGEHAQQDLLAAQRLFTELGDRAWQSRVARNLGELALSRGAPNEADEWWTTAMAHSVDDPETQVDIAYRAAEGWTLAGNADAALRWLTAELEVAAQFDEETALAWRSAYAGALLGSGGRDEASLRFFLDARTRFEELGDERSATRVRLDVAANLSDLGRHAEALAQLDLCLAFANAHSDRAVRRSALSHLGEVARRSDDLGRARRALQEAVELARDLEDDEGLANSLGNLGRVLAQSGENEAARDLFVEQLALAKRLRDDQERASALGGLALAALHERRFAPAASYSRRAVQLYAGRFAPGEVENLGGWLEAVVELGHDDESQTLAQRLVDVAQASGLEGTAATAFARAARVLLRRGQWRPAADFYRASIQLPLVSVSKRPDATEAAFALLWERLVILVSHVDTDLPEDERGAFYDQLVASLSEQLPDLSDVVRTQLSDVRAELEEQGFLRNLGDAEPPD